MSKVLIVDEANFEQVVLRSERPVLVDFWAPWCGPCVSMGRVVEEVAEKVSPAALVAKMNIDVNPDTPAKYSVRSIPTFAVFWKGEVVETHVGSASRDKLVGLVFSHLPGDKPGQGGDESEATQTNSEGGGSSPSA